MRRTAATAILIVLLMSALGVPSSSAGRGDTTISPTCMGEQPTISGTASGDRLVGTEGPDVIHGYGGNDEIDGLGGDDLICGGSGRDLIVGGLGQDTIFGNRGADRLRGGPGDDLLAGGIGRDVARGGSGVDLCNIEVRRSCYVGTDGLKVTVDIDIDGEMTTVEGVGCPADPSWGDNHAAWVTLGPFEWGVDPGIFPPTPEGEHIPSWTVQEIAEGDSAFPSGDYTWRVVLNGVPESGDKVSAVCASDNGLEFGLVRYEVELFE